MIDHKTKKHEGKCVVHCSAGIGRTGVLLSLYELVMSLESQFKNSEDADISIFKTVRKLREQRWGLVATQQQYEFIYKFMEYWITAYLYTKEN